jgi:hypothetical protein
MVWLLKVLAFFAFSQISPYQGGAIAGEFGNVFSQNAEVEAASRSASVQALDGMVTALSALRRRELGDQGGDGLLSASDTLFSATKQMESIIDLVPDFAFDESARELIISKLGHTRGRYDMDISGAENFAQFFVMFVALGERLAFQLKDAASLPVSARAYPIFSETLSDYLVMGDLVAELSSSRAG